MKARGSLVRNLCACGKKQVSAGLDSKGRQTYRTRCKSCIKAARSLKKGYCEHCGLVPTDKSILQTDHIDRDVSNNNINNIQTLCHKCHIVKTNANKEWSHSYAKKMSKM